MIWFHKNRDFLKQMFRLAIPIAAQNLIWSSLSFVDNIIVAGLGEIPLAIVTLINQYFFIFYLLQFGVTSGASIFAAQFWGSRDIPNIKRVLGLTLLTMMGGSILFFLPTVFFPEFILGFFTDDMAIITEGKSFLRIIAASNLLLSVSASFMFVLRSIGNVRLPMVVSSIALVVNTVLNYILIYGLFSIPKIGLNGSAVATLLARFVEVSLMLLVVYLTKSPIAASLREMFDFKRDYIKTFYRTTTPVIMNELVWSVGISMYYVVYGRMGSEAVAAMSITSTVEKVAFTLLMGLGNACGILVGHKIGEGKDGEAYAIGQKCLKAVLVSGILTCFAVVLASRALISIFHVSPSVMEIAFKNLLLFAVFSIFRGVNFTGICGILRSGGDTKYSFLLDTSFLWIYGVPVAFLCGLVLHLPVYVVYLFVSFEDIIKAVFVLRRVKSGKWMNNLTQMENTV